MITSCFLPYPGLWFLFFLSSFFLSRPFIHIVSCRLLSYRLRCLVPSRGFLFHRRLLLSFVSSSSPIESFTSSPLVLLSHQLLAAPVLFFSLSFKNSQNIRLLLTFLSRPASSLVSIMSLATLASREPLPSETPPCPVGWRTAWDSKTSRLPHPLPPGCPSLSQHASCPTAAERQSARWPPCGAARRRTSPGTPRPPAPPAEPEMTSRRSCDAE